MPEILPLHAKALFDYASMIGGEGFSRHTREEMMKTGQAQGTLHPRARPRPATGLAALSMAASNNRKLGNKVVVFVRQRIVFVRQAVLRSGLPLASTAINGIADCCARAASGHAATNPVIP